MFENKYLILGILLMVVVAVSGCTMQNQTSQNQTPAANTVNIKNMAFNPSTITVQMGTTVKWVNMDNTAHTVTSDNGVFDSGNMDKGASFSYTFNQEGTFAYHCTLHPDMHGTVTVISSLNTGSGSSGIQSNTSSNSQSNTSGGSQSNNYQY